MSPTNAVERPIIAWERLDLNGIDACFAKDAVWHNMPYGLASEHDRAA